MNKIEEFFAGLIADNDKLKMLFDDHLVQYDELLPHVLMGDVTRFIVKLAISPTTGKRSEGELQRILDYFERAVDDSSEEIRNLLSVSFLENLEQSNSSYPIIKNRLGKELKKDLYLIETFYS